MQKYFNGESSEFTDSQLIEKTVSGDQVAFVFLLERYMGLIGSKAKKFVGGSSEYDDLFQEGTLALYNAVCTYDVNKEASFKTYAAVCVENRMLSVKRSERSVLITDEVVAADGVTNPEELVIERENIALIYKRMEDLLTEKEFSVLTLYLSGCSYDTIAWELQMQRKAVDNALQRVRRKMKRAIS